VLVSTWGIGTIACQIYYPTWGAIGMSLAERMLYMKDEPKVNWCTIRESENQDGYSYLDIECRMSDGQKIAALQINKDFPELAVKIRDFLNQRT